MEILIRDGEWDEARRVLVLDRENDPADHWVLTQIGVTYYEQRRYEEALPLFLASLRLLPDCPLTLWNLAGTLDALGFYGGAVRVYTWLIESRRTAEDDPCWESQTWTDSLKADCVYPLGATFEHLGEGDQAEHCYRQYLNLLAIGIAGLYPAEAVLKRIRALQAADREGSAAGRFREALESTLNLTGIERRVGGEGPPPAFDEATLLASPGVAGRR